MLIENSPKKKAANIRVDKIHTFEGHPFQVIDNEEMDNLAESIKAQGIISPLIVPYGVKSPWIWGHIGTHCRLYAAIKAGLTEVPALIYPLDRNQAVIAVVDSNLHREKLLPSEKAFAYKMKLEAIKRQASSAIYPPYKSYPRTVTKGGRECDSVQSRCGTLLPYWKATRNPVDAMALNDCTPSHAQSIRLKKLAQQGVLSSDSIYEILSEEKANQMEHIRFKVDDLRGFFPKNYTSKQMTDTILKLLYDNQRKIERIRRSHEER